MSEKISETEYNADYESEAKGGFVNAEGIISNRDLSDALNGAEFLLGNKNESKIIYNKETVFYRIIKVEFWHEFKSLYSKIKNLDLSSEYDYIVRDLTNNLNNKVNILDAIYDINDSNYNNYKTYIESEDWRVGLLDLVDLIDEIEDIDVSSESKSSFGIVKSKVQSVKKSYDMGFYDLMDSAWLDIRERCEGLSFNIGANSSLKKEIAECEALDRSIYTKATWDRLKTCLAEAKEVTEYSLNISTARKALATARANLREIGLEEDIIRLKTWISISEDLDVADYYTEGYDKLILNIACINPDDMIKRSDVNSAIGTVVNLYNNLELIEFIAEAEPTILNINTLPYFVIAAVLFTGAVVSGSYVMSLKRQMRRGTQE